MTDDLDHNFSVKINIIYFRIRVRIGVSKRGRELSGDNKVSYELKNTNI